MPLKIAAQYRIPLKWGSSSGCPARSVTLENSKIRNLKKTGIVHFNSHSQPGQKRGVQTKSSYVQAVIKIMKSFVKFTTPIC